jgi:hypothetical protein
LYQKNLATLLDVTSFEDNFAQGSWGLHAFRCRLT